MWGFNVFAPLDFNEFYGFLFLSLLVNTIFIVKIRLYLRDKVERIRVEAWGSHLGLIHHSEDCVNVI